MYMMHLHDHGQRHISKEHNKILITQVQPINIKCFLVFLMGVGSRWLPVPSRNLSIFRELWWQVICHKIPSRNFEDIVSVRTQSRAGEILT